ncbi:MAG: hypothetical protein LC798_05570 [Chloroflexi bacterium]|nr:hypothetical protein [Chloroflexota bacterium]
MAREVAQAKKVAIQKAALGMKRDIEAKLPSSKRLRGVGRKGARVGVRFDMRGDDAVVKATGPLHLLERDTKAHTIKPKRAPKGRGGGIVMPDGSVRRSARHPGTKGQHPFERGMEAGRDKAARTIKNATTDALRRGMSA